MQIGNRPADAPSSLRSVWAQTATGSVGGLLVPTAAAHEARQSLKVSSARTLSAVGRN